MLASLASTPTNDESRAVRATAPDYADRLSLPDLLYLAAAPGRCPLHVDLFNLFVMLLVHSLGANRLLSLLPVRHVGQL